MINLLKGIQTNVLIIILLILGLIYKTIIDHKGIEYH